MNLQLTSNAFDNGQPIPFKHTCDGQDLSPPLKWGEPPDRTQSFALICEDPDAPSGSFDHWVLFNLPPGARELEEGLPDSLILTNGAKQGVNGFRRVGYGGPCPPKQDDAHRYFFRLYALDIELPTQEGAAKQEVKRAMEGHVLAEGALMGTYAKMKAGGKTSAG
jgi:Raf kinase inhibitor-like YbhB/YbcL family protein